MAQETLQRLLRGLLPKMPQAPVTGPIRPTGPAPNPRAAAALDTGVDVVLGALGVNDPLAEGATKATGLGSLLGMLGPAAMVGGVRQVHLPLGALSRIPTRAEAAAANRIAQGYKTPAYHGTQAKVHTSRPDLEGAVDDFIPMQEAIPTLRRGGAGLKMMDGLGVHAGTPQAADQRLTSNMGAPSFDKLTAARARNPEKSAADLHGSYQIPLYLKTDNPLLKRDGSVMSEVELQAMLSRLAKRLGFKDTRRFSKHSPVGELPAAQAAVREELQRKGFDSIPYRNSHEDRGSTSWIVLDPSQARSQFADFHPWRTKSRDLLASIAVGAGLQQGLAPVDKPPTIR